jgi:capsid protein
MKLPAFLNFNRVAPVELVTTPDRSASCATETSAPIVRSGGYDAATDSPARSSFLAFPLTARREFTGYNRIQILRKVRAIEANFGLFPRIKSTVGKYSVGIGISPVPQTSDTAWNEAAVKLFNDWANNRFVCDVAGAMTFWERQRFHAETFFGDGESFDALVSSSFSGAPQLQLFDCSEIGNPFFGGNSQGFIDGVRVNSANRPIEYQVSQQLSPVGNPYGYAPITTFPIAANDMIHIVRRKRANQLRGISHFHAEANAAVDVMDLNALVTASAKLHEAMGIQVTKEAGEAGKNGVTGQITKMLDPSGNGATTEVQEKFLGGALIQYLKAGEKIEIISSDRPSQNLREWIEYRIRAICTNTGLPSEIVWNMADLGGAPARIVLADAQWFFDSVQDLLNETFNQRIWVWWCASMMKSGQLAKCKDARWWSCHWQGPPKLTADAGRTAQSEIDLLHAGFNSWSDFYNQRGRNWKPVLGQRIQELKWAKAECDAAGIPLEYIFSLKPGTKPADSADE